MNPILLNLVVEVLLAVLIYPGVVVALIAAAILAWVRGAAQGAPQGVSQGVSQRGTETGQGGGLAALRSSWSEETRLPAGVYAPLLTACTLLAMIFPLLALILLPVPGNPLAFTLGLGGDLVAEAALLLGLPLVRLLLGWIVPTLYTRLAADRGARLLAGAVLPMGLAIAAAAEETATLRLDTPPLGVSLPLISLVARLLAALAFACVLPVLARGAVARQVVSGETASPSGELAELTGRDAVLLRIGEALQLVAVAAFFVAAFLLPLLTQINAPAARWGIWVIGLLIVAAGIGRWQGWTASQGRVETEMERPPLTWWLGLPVLLALAALVAAAWATRAS